MIDSSVQRLLDESAIRDLANRYVHYLWSEDAASLAALFTEDGEIRHRAEGLHNDVVGRQAVEELLTVAVRERKPRPLTHNHVIDFLSEHHATGSCFVEAFDGTDAYSALLIARYDDEYVKREGAWRFRVRQPTIFKVKSSLVAQLRAGSSADRVCE